MTDAPKPLAQGDLAQTPLAHVLLSLLDRGLDGTLAIWPEGRSGQDRVLFEQGVPVDARLLEPAATLERGLLPLFQRERGPYAFYGSDLVGETKLRGAVDPYHLLAASLRGGFRTDVVEAVIARYGDRPVRVNASTALARFELIPKERAVLDVLRAEPQSVRALADTTGEPKIVSRLLYLLAITQQLELFTGEVGRKSLVEATISGAAPPAKAPPSAQPAPSSKPKDEFEETFFVPPSGSPPASQPSASPRATSGAAPRPSMTAPPSTSSRPSGASPPSTPEPSARRPGDPEPPPPMPTGLAAEHEKRWREIVSYAETIDTQNFFEMLGVSQTASPDEARTAYFALVKKWHPDRLAPDLLPLKPVAERIFRHLTEAHETLADVDKRGPYLKSVQGGGGTPAAERELQAVLEAAMQFQKIDVLVRRRDFLTALKLLDEILLLAPEEADYHAARGQVLFKMHGTQDAKQVEAALRAVEAALTRDDRCERALVTKAEILQRTGKENESFAIWAKVYELYPKNVDAQRMKRLADMRGVTSARPSSRPSKPPGRTSQRPPPKDDGGGLLSKLFGGKKK
ncbi:MAG: DnaJ domain-containing protein [Sandaracinus sp.]|nr:DnaJ domain-containing protein [Sandaracinus sp.]